MGGGWACGSDVGAGADSFAIAGISARAGASVVDTGTESAISMSSVGAPFGMGAAAGSATVVGESADATCGVCSEGSAIVWSMRA